jgi:hypothetical protein
MRAHWKGIIWLFLLVAGGFTAAIVFGSLYLALVFLIGGLVVAFIMTTAWMRPPGSPIEHHAPTDKLVNDTRP